MCHTKKRAYAICDEVRDELGRRGRPRSGADVYVGGGAVAASVLAERGRLVGTGEMSVLVGTFDAVGAGDSYMGAMLVHLQRIGAASPGAMGRMTAQDWNEAMRFAARVAAINCTRAGCDPPTIAELD